MARGSEVRERDTREQTCDSIAGDPALKETDAMVCSGGSDSATLRQNVASGSGLPFAGGVHARQVTSTLGGQFHVRAHRGPNNSAGKSYLFEIRPVKSDFSLRTTMADFFASSPPSCRSTFASALTLRRRSRKRRVADTPASLTKRMH